MIHSLLSGLAKILLAPLIFAFSLAGYSTFQTTQDTPVTLGAYNPTGGQTYRLQSSVGSSDTSMTLSSFKEPISNIPYTMSYLNSSIEYGTIEPNNNNSKEFISFSGITQNTDGTATLTGLVRGLGFSYPYTSSTTLQNAHPGQSIFILSNPPQLTNQYLNKNNDESVTGIVQFAIAPINTGVNATSSHQFVTLGELGSVAITGAATSTDTIMGISALANIASLISGSASTTAGAPRVIPAYVASTAPRTSDGFIALTDSTGKIPASYIATTSAFSWTGNQTFSGGVTSITATLASVFTLNTIPYSFPSSAPTATSSLMLSATSGGTSVLKWQPLDGQQVASTTGATALYATTSPASFYDVNVIVSGKTGNCPVKLNFNNDRGPNYFWRTAINGAASTGSSNDSSFQIGGDSTTTESHHFLHVQNINGFMKTVTGTTITNGAVRGIGDEEAFSGLWNNSTTSVTSIGVSSGVGCTLNAGSFLEVKASSN